MLANIAQVIGSIGVVVSILFLAWQARRLTEELKMGNSVATLNAMNSGIIQLHTFLSRLAEDPSLRPYFYESKPTAGLSKDQQDRLTIIAEMLADNLDFGLTSSRLLPKVKEADDWTNYIVFLLAHSPVFKRVVEQNPAEWWPELAALRVEHQSELSPSAIPAARIPSGA